MQELRLVMIVIGVVAIVALLIHGLWASRKERPEKFGERPIRKVMEKDKDGFDSDGVSAVRVVRSAAVSQQGSAGFSQDPLFFGDESEQKSSPKKSPQKKTSEKKIAKNQPVHSKMKTVKDFYHFEDTEEDIALAEEEQALLRGQNEQRSKPEQLEPDQSTQSQPEPEQQVLIFNVQAQASRPFKGEELFSCLEQYGMHFGEMNIFHRHVENSGVGKVLFSAANMLNPGSFNISTLHQFTTPGITFFMTLPCYGEAEQNFKLMLKTAQQVADLLGGHVTDDYRNLLTPKRLDEYREKIKLFMAVT